MYIIQLRDNTGHFGQFKDWVDGFDTFQDAKEYATTKMADIFEEDYGTTWRVVRDCDQEE